MAQPYVGELRLFAGNFAPAGWMFCDGSLLPISENETLFQLIGTTYGGDGQSTFAVPDLRGRLTVHQGNGFVLAQTGGAEQVTLTTSQIPAHAHTQLASGTVATQNAPSTNVFAQAATADAYVTGGPFVALDPAAMAFTGGNQPHSNLQPYLCINYIISLFGIYPTPT